MESSVGIIFLYGNSLFIDSTPVSSAIPYNRPRITAELRRRGWMVYMKRVHRLLREDNSLCVSKCKFVVGFLLLLEGRSSRRRH
jgi:hypothetical protein